MRAFSARAAQTPSVLTPPTPPSPHSVLIFFRAAPLTLSLCVLMTAIHFAPSPLQRLHLTYTFGLPCFQWHDLAAAGLRGAVAALLEACSLPCCTPA